MNWNKLTFVFVTTAMFGAASLFGAAGDTATPAA